MMTTIVESLVLFDHIFMPTIIRVRTIVAASLHGTIFATELRNTVIGCVQRRLMNKRTDFAGATSCASHAPRWAGTRQLRGFLGAEG